MRMLVVEDDPLLGYAVQSSLTRSGHAVDWVRTAADSALSMSTHVYDLLILDLGLPDLSGEEVLRRLRGKRSALPVIVTTARGGINDRVALLDLGADDYLVKPFDLDELNARIRSVLRRSPLDDGRDGALTYGPLQLFPHQHSANWYGEQVTLTHREYCVLEALVRKRNHVLSRAQLEEALYGWGEEVDSNAVEVYVHFLRRKLGANLIQTVRGVGYQLAALHTHA
jgi:DNA-binding response OmpR family regulator